jgi:hypothetical protein
MANTFGSTRSPSANTTYRLRRTTEFRLLRVGGWWSEANTLDVIGCEVLAAWWCYPVDKVRHTLSLFSVCFVLCEETAASRRLPDATDIDEVARWNEIYTFFYKAEELLTHEKTIL